MLEFSNLCYCVQHPCKLTSRDFWSSKNKRNLLSKHKYVLRKCCGVSQKQCMMELSNLCYCVQLCLKLTSRNFWSSSNERKPLYKQKCVLRKYCRCMNWWYFQNFAIVFSTPVNLLVGISGALVMKESHFISKNVFWENTVGI